MTCMTEKDLNKTNKNEIDENNRYRRLFLAYKFTKNVFNDSCWNASCPETVSSNRTTGQR